MSLEIGRSILNLKFSKSYVVNKVSWQDHVGINLTITSCLQLCLDIYLVRESRELDLEEDLFAKLVFLYRSPETLIKWTRPPEEIGEDEAEEQPELD